MRLLAIDGIGSLSLTILLKLYAGDISPSSFRLSVMLACRVEWYKVYREVDLITGHLVYRSLALLSVSKLVKAL